MKWINAKERLPDYTYPASIYAARWVRGRNPLDVVTYDQLCMIGFNTIRIGCDEYEEGQDILANVDWLEEEE